MIFHCSLWLKVVSNLKVQFRQSCIKYETGKCNEVQNRAVVFNLSSAKTSKYKKYNFSWNVFCKHVFCFRYYCQKQRLKSGLFKMIKNIIKFDLGVPLKKPFLL